MKEDIPESTTNDKQLKKKKSKVTTKRRTLRQEETRLEDIDINFDAKKVEEKPKLKSKKEILEKPPV